MMQTVSLDGVWELAYGPQRQEAADEPARWREGRKCIPARVPGNVELDLVAAGELPADLARGNRIYDVQRYEDHEWWYRRTFRAFRPKEGRAELLFEGLDCLGTIWLNGRRIGRTDNMLIEHRFDVTEILADGENELIVRIAPAVPAGRARPMLPGEWSLCCNAESLAIRKAPYMYGWDILPRIVSAGLWRSVRLEYVPPARIAETWWRTREVRVEECTARLAVDWRVESRDGLSEDWRVRVRLEREGKTPFMSIVPCRASSGTLEISLEDVAFWWPRGYGEPALYDATVELLDPTGAVADQRQEKIGVRTMELRRTDLTSPEGEGEFVFVVNGCRVFVRGTNWVPLDSFPSRMAQHLARTFEMAVDLNCNMIRCWGGNVYEDHAFYDLCDAHGVMVWQDFAMACAVYPQTEAFAEQIRREAEFLVRKFRNRASLAVWAGDNECDMAHGWAKDRPPLDPNRNRLTRQVLPEVLQRLDPVRPYLPSSPYVSPALYSLPREQWHTRMPEDHLWGPRDDFKGPFYTTSAAHFVSEIGYHGCPCLETLRDMLDPEFLWPWQNNEQWLTHAVRPAPGIAEYNYRIPLMASQIAVLFGSVPETPEDFVLASQISQAEADKYFLERWRMGKWRRTGMLLWNLRDGWPVFSDAMVDYFYRRKLAYEYIRRVQTDVCVMCGEAQEGRHAVIVADDTREAATGRVVVRDADTRRSLLETDYRVPANANAVVGHIPASDVPAMWLIEYTCGGKTFRNHYLAGPRPFRLEDYRRWLAAILPNGK